MTKTLAQATRRELEAYLIDVHCMGSEEVKEWHDKQDMAADIRSFGWEADAIEYIS